MIKLSRHLSPSRIRLKQCSWARQRSFSSTRRLSNGYYILLPSIPADTASNNPLLETTGLPKFSEISEDHVLNALQKITIDYESAFYRFEEDIQKARKQRTFASVFGPLDKLNHSLLLPFTSAKILSRVRKSERLDDALLTTQQGVQRCLSLPNMSTTLLRAIKEIDKEEKGLNYAQKRVLRKYLLESELSGMDLNTSDLRLYQSCLGGLREKQEIFRINLVTTTQLVGTRVIDPKSMEDMPREVLQLFSKSPAESGSARLLSLRNPEFNAYMSYCSDRPSRKAAWQALVSRAGFRDPSTNNSLIIEDIRQLRSKEAKALGYENYGALSMETKMAGSVSTIMSAVSEMTIPSKAKCQTELVALQSFAGEQGFSQELQLWDVAYWRRRQRQELFKVRQDDTRPFFPFPFVLDTLFTFCQQLFDVKIRKSAEKVPVWHKDVEFHEVLDGKGSRISSFYLDPYARPEEKSVGSYLELGQNRSQAAESEPVVALMFSFLPPTGKAPSLLSYEELTAFFQKFGQALQHLLTTVPYGDVSGMNNLEWDALNVAGSAFRMLLKRPEVLQSFSKNFKDGNQISSEMIERLYKADRHLSSLDLLGEMYFGVLDLSFYTKADFWQDIMKDVWRDFMPFSLEKNDSHPCSFSHIFIGPYPAAYYSFLWSEMVAADVASGFEKEGRIDQGSLKESGRRFRDTFLSLGGSVPTAEVFRRFRGRDPAPQALLRHLDISYPS